MSLAHTAFLFDYRAFQSAATPLAAELDAGNPEPLRARVAEIRRKVGSSKNWILHDKGTEMGDFGRDRDPRYQGGLWGNWFLTILSTFLSPCVELGYDWPKLSCMLHSFKWTDEDVWKVLVGLPTVLLSRPNVPYNINPNEVVPIEKPVPYWYLMAPDRSTYCGWLPVEKVEKLHQRLLVGQHMLEEDLRTRIELPPNVSAANAHISPDLNPDYWYERIPIVYQRFP